jgi:hypothetical protein
MKLKKIYSPIDRLSNNFYEKQAAKILSIVDEVPSPLKERLFISLIMASHKVENSVIRKAA